MGNSTVGASNQHNAIETPLWLAHRGMDARSMTSWAVLVYGRVCNTDEPWYHAPQRLWRCWCDARVVIQASSVYLHQCPFVNRRYHASLYSQHVPVPVPGCWQSEQAKSLYGPPVDSSIFARHTPLPSARCSLAFSHITVTRAVTNDTHGNSCREVYICVSSTTSCVCLYYTETAGSFTLAKRLKAYNLI